MEEARQSGMKAVGDIPWGTHLCVFYHTQEDLIELLVPYFKAGLESNEFCMWVTSEPLNVEDARRSLAQAVENLDDYIEKGQIEILDYSPWYTGSGRFDGAEVLQAWLDKEQQALGQGFDGLRLTGNTFWLEAADWKAFTEYDAAIDRVIGNYRMLALCTYSLDRCGAAEVIDVVSNHQFALIRRDGDWEIIESAERMRAKSERDTTLKALQENEARFRALVESSSDHIFMLDRDGTFLFSNSRVGQFGLESGQSLLGRHLRDVYPSEVAEFYQQQFEQVLATGQAVSFEHPMVEPDGSHYHVDTLYPIRRDSDIWAVGGICRDITERRRAEEALRLSEEQFSKAFHSGPLLMTISAIDDGTYLEVNENFVRISGYSREDSIGTTSVDLGLISGKDREKLKQTLLSKGKVDGMELTLRKKSGETFYCLYFGELITVAGKQRLLSIAKDITERKQAEKEVQQRNRELEALLEVSQRLAGQLDVDQLLDTITRSTVETLPAAEAASLWLYDEPSEQLAARAWAGHDDEAMSGLTVSPDTSLVGLIWKTRQAKIIDDASREPVFERLVQLAPDAVHSVIGVPLMVEDRLLGALFADNHSRVQAFDTHDLRLLQSLANQAAIAIQNTRLYGAVREELAERKRAEAALLENTKRLLKAQRVAKMGFLDWNLKTDEMIWSDQVYDLYGVDKHAEKSSIDLTMQLVHPDDLEFVEKNLEMAIQGVKEYDIDHRQVRPDGKVTWVHALAELVRDADGNPDSLLGTVVDITERKRTERLLQALNRAALAMEQALTPDEIFTAVAEEFDNVGWSCALFLTDESQSRLFPTYLSLESAAIKAAEKLVGLKRGSFSIRIEKVDVYREVVQERKTVLVEDVEEITRQLLPGPLGRFAGRMVRMLGVPRAIDAPLIIEDEVIGVLAVQSDDLTEADVSTITAFAHQVAAAWRKAQLFGLVQASRDRMRQLARQMVSAQEEERRNISQELHDELGQALTAIAFDLAAIEEELGPDLAPAIKSRLVDARSLAGQVDERVSEMALDLRPSMLDDLGLLPTLHWYTNRYAQRLDIEVEVEAINFDERLLPEMETALCRIVQEALTNVAKHAQASKVGIRLERTESALVAIVEDNGQGFEVGTMVGPSLPARGAGLLGIQERADLLGGTLSIESTPGQGTRLIIKVPI